MIADFHALLSDKAFDAIHGTPSMVPFVQE